MGARPFELTRLDPDTFEHMANALALRVLGPGVTGFAPGADGGRDGFFEGEASYPSERQRWKGRWYIQSKFHPPHLTKNAQSWLLSQVRGELEQFADPDSERVWPDNWIIVSNIDLSGTPNSGTFDKIKAAVKAKRPGLEKNTHVWGGRKVMDFLVQYPDVSQTYGAFVTPGDVLAAITNRLSDDRATAKDLLHYLSATIFAEQQYTKLEQAGSSSDTRPRIQDLFTDLPFEFSEGRGDVSALRALTKTLALSHKPSIPPVRSEAWDRWHAHPFRSRIWFVRGGPGQGKSTLTQYVCQIQRAALLLSDRANDSLNPKILEQSEAVKIKAEALDFWPLAARVPVSIELRMYAQWFGTRTEQDPKGVLSYLAHVFGRGMDHQIEPGTIKRALSGGRWLFVFDGLDEVPSDVKDTLSAHLTYFVDDQLISLRSDAVIVCTSRPQGYSGQFDTLTPTLVNLAPLSAEQALACAAPVLAIDRNPVETESAVNILRAAIASPAVREIMTTPLQSHIMAVVVRDGGRPPERKWQLFSNFYQVIKKREANRNLPSPRISRLLREGDKLIKTVHNRLGFELHARAETSTGAETSIEKSDLAVIVSEIVIDLQDSDIDATVETLMEATTERLVLVNTPESGDRVRFDIRPLQEFFAAEYLYETANDEGFSERLRVIAEDSHWREVMHFLISALVERDRRGKLAQAVQVLLEVDNPSDADARALHRRLAIGGVIVARLLREGVAEADKRVRQGLRPCLDALLASTGARSMLPILTSPHTRDWMALVITEAFKEKTSPENIGAACLAPLIMNSHQDTLDRPDDYLSEQSIAYKAAVFQMADPGYSRNRSREDFPNWFIRFVIRELLSATWASYDRLALRVCYRILASAITQTRLMALSLGLSAEAVDLFCSIFSESTEKERLQRPLNTGIDGLSVSVRDGNNLLYRVESKPELFAELQKTGGFLLFAARLSTVVQGRQFDDLIAEAVSEDVVCDMVRKLPEEVTSLYCNQGEMTAPFCASLDKLIRREHLNKRLTYSFTGNSASVDWNQLSMIFPSIISMHLNERFHGGSANFDRWFRNLDSGPAIISAVRRFPFALADISTMISIRPDLEDELKKSICMPSARELPVFSSSNASISLNLPSDAGILPAIISYMEIIDLDLVGREVGNPTDQLDLLRNVILGFVVTSEALSEIYRDESSELSVRIAAGALLIPFAINNGSIGRHLVEIAALITQSQQFSSLALIFEWLTPLVKNRDEAAVKFIDQMLEACRENLSVRVEIESAITGWREIGRAPVTSSRHLQIWR